jgi:tripartite-type tricarboxylate transporter receptor subunit TctC
MTIFFARQLSMKTVLALIFSLACGSAFAQNFPNHAIRIIVPFTPSGPTDTVARAVGERLAKKWNVPVIVENKPGAGTTIGSDIVAKAPPDGHTILLAVTAHTINPTLMRKLPYDTLKDFAPLTLIATAPNLLAVGPKVPAATVPEFIAWLKANPGKFNAGSHGKGNMSHLAAEMFKAATDTSFTVVQYRGAQPASVALLSGEVEFMFDTGVVIPSVQAGKLRIIATTGRKRAAVFPEVPTLIESGLPGFEAVSWYGFLTTGGTPKPILDTLSRALIEAINDPEIRERITSANMEPVAGSAAELDSLIKVQIGRWAKVIKDANIEIE